MSIETCEKGQLMRLSINIQDVDATDVDPTTLALKVLPPSGTEVTYTYSGGGLTKDTVGDYYKDLDADEEGEWYYQWVSTGSGQGAKSGQFTVLPSPF